MKFTANLLVIDVLTTITIANTQTANHVCQIKTSKIQKFE